MYRSQFLKRLLLTLPLVLIPKILRSEEVSMTKDDFQKGLESATTLKQLAVFVEKLSPIEKNLHIDSAWSIGTVLSHCAQSIRYSISGYPQMKSAFFRGTIGFLVFSIFSLRGKMNHGLEEPIPGAEKIELQLPFELGKKELLEAIQNFEATQVENLKPHFAYGELNKKDYDSAHALHIKNHFERITFS
jgi:hypothetical protein